MNNIGGYYLLNILYSDILNIMSKTKLTIARHILKTITWRIVGTIDTILIGWAVSGDPMVGLTIGSFEIFTKMILYFIHERVWYKVNLGIKRDVDNEKLK